MRNIRLAVEYDGTRYHGFQRQKKHPSIQGEIEGAIKHLTGEEIKIRGASRTDAGAHAKGQVVNFRTLARLPIERWVRALNYYLPRDVMIKEALEVTEDFDSRRCARKREYCYYVWNSPVLSAFWVPYAYHCPRSLDVEAMGEAGKGAEGLHDFASFTSPAVASDALQTRSTERTMHKLGISRKGDLISFRMVADSFLPHQIRSMVGTLLQVGMSKIDGVVFEEIMKARDRRLAGPAVPARGLFLMRVDYGGEQ
ncbi:MAG: tRNA pseudouridine(38-40) synthase TruA [Chloroflexi bacterium]|nr:tRNA pseudouridine(38-40) synthase TruA [Chloroflexota bacterium]